MSQQYVVWTRRSDGGVDAPQRFFRSRREAREWAAKQVVGPGVRLVVRRARARQLRTKAL